MATYPHPSEFDVARGSGDSLSIRVTNAIASDDGSSVVSDDDDDRGSVATSAATEQEEVIVATAPTNSALEDFRRDVKIWMDLDNTVKKLKTMAKEKVKTQRDLTAKIIAFMSKYNIEDLNTRDGKLRYKVKRVKPPAPRQVVIKERLEACLKGNPDLCKHVIQRVFVEDAAADESSKVTLIEKPCLKRLKGTRKSMTVA
jgi:hypothetical protein